MTPEKYSTEHCWYAGDSTATPSDTIGMAKSADGRGTRPVVLGSPQVEHLFKTVEVGLPLAAPQIEQPNLPVSITISSIITLSVSGFAARWMFSQIIDYWRQQIQDLKKDLDGLKSDISALSTKDEEIRIDLSKLKIDIAQEYVSREDWIRSSVGLENKLERLGLRIDDKFERMMERLPISKNWDKN